MSLPDIIEDIAARRFLTRKTTRAVLEDFFATLAEAVWQDGRASVPGLGTFVVRQRKARRTPSGLVVPPHSAVTCRVSPRWRTR